MKTPYIGQRVTVKKHDGVCSYLHGAIGIVESSRECSLDGTLFRVKFDVPVPRHWTPEPLESCAFKLEHLSF